MLQNAFVGVLCKAIWHTLEYFLGQVLSASITLSSLHTFSVHALLSLVVCVASFSTACS